MNSEIRPKEVDPLKGEITSKIRPTKILIFHNMIMFSTPVRTVAEVINFHFSTLSEMSVQKHLLERSGFHHLTNPKNYQIV